MKQIKWCHSDSVFQCNDSSLVWLARWFLFRLWHSTLEIKKEKIAFWRHIQKSPHLHSRGVFLDGRDVSTAAVAQNHTPPLALPSSLSLSLSLLETVFFPQSYPPHGSLLLSRTCQLLLQAAVNSSSVATRGEDRLQPWSKCTLPFIHNHSFFMLLCGFLCAYISVSIMHKLASYTGWMG